MQHVERGGVIRLKKEVTIYTAKVTQAHQSNYWRGIRGDKVVKQQQRGLFVPNLDSVNPAKPFISDKYNNNIELKKLKGENYFIKALLELRARGFSKEEVRICANITSMVDKLVVWHKELHTYREFYGVYIESTIVHPDMVGKGEVGFIGVKGGVNYGVVNVLWNKIIRRVQTTKSHNTLVHIST